MVFFLKGKIYIYIYIQFTKIKVHLKIYYSNLNHNFFSVMLKTKRNISYIFPDFYLHLKIHFDLIRHLKRAIFLLKKDFFSICMQSLIVKCDLKLFTEYAYEF